MKESTGQDLDRFHRRKHPRMRHYDYSQPGYYFVTVCTKDKRCIFGEPNQLNRYGKIAEQGLAEIHAHFPCVHVDKSVVMPNHIHGIIVLHDSSVALSVVIGQYKSAVAKMIRENEQDIKVWQASFHDHVIRNQSDYERIWSYIDTNPMRWQKDCFYVE